MGVSYDAFSFARVPSPLHCSFPEFPLRLLACHLPTAKEAPIILKSSWGCGMMGLKEWAGALSTHSSFLYHQKGFYPPSCLTWSCCQETISPKESLGANVIHACQAANCPAPVQIPAGGPGMPVVSHNAMLCWCSAGSTNTVCHHPGPWNYIIHTRDCDTGTRFSCRPRCHLSAHVFTRIIKGPKMYFTISHVNVSAHPLMFYVLLMSSTLTVSYLDKLHLYTKISMDIHLTSETWRGGGGGRQLLQSISDFRVATLGQKNFKVRFQNSWTRAHKEVQFFLSG